MEENHTTINAERLREFTAVLQKYKSGKASLERRVVAAENWWKLRNRFEERRHGLSDDGGFKSESGWLHNVIVSKHADAMEAYPEPVILPREPGDKEEARLLSAILPCILEQNRFEHTYDLAMWQKLKTGTACYRVVWDSEKQGGLGDIAIERVDLLNLFWEPGVGDIQDSKYLFCTHLEDEEALAARYPQLRGRMKSNPFLATRFVYDDAVSLEGKATVIEVYYKKRLGGRTVLHYCRYVGDCVLYATENEALGIRQQASGNCAPPLPVAEEGGGQFAQRSENARIGASPQRFPGTANREEAEGPDGAVGEGLCVPCGYVPSRDPGYMTGERATARVGTTEETGTAVRGLYDHGKYPFVLDPLFPVEGSPCGYGFVDLCANGQTAIDLLRTAFVKNALVGATPRYFQRIDGAVNEEEFLDISRPLVHVRANLGEDSLRQIRYLGLPGAYLNVLESTIKELRETSGNTETATGIVHSGVTAASAIAALQEASGKGSRDATRSSYIAFGEIIELCIELIRQFYTLPRQFRITGTLGEDYVSFSNQGLLPRPLPPVGGVEMGLREPVFDVKVSAQKRSAYSRLSQNELALELYKLGLFEQGREQQALSCLNMMEFDGREELMRRLSAAMGLEQKLRELQNYRALALELAKRYRPDLALGLLGQEPAPPPAEGEEPALPHEAPAAENARIAAAQAVAP